jgi:uncharacterized protein
MNNKLRARLADDLKNAMRNHDTQKVATLRLIHAAMKQKEVDERITLEDDQIVGVLNKMVKQRKDSIEQFKQGGRDDLVNKEQAELDLILTYLPAPIKDEEIDALIKDAVTELQMTSIKDMAKIMSVLKIKIQGRADMGKVSQKLKDYLNSLQ